MSAVPALLRSRNDAPVDKHAEAIREIRRRRASPTYSESSNDPQSIASFFHNLST